MKSLSIEQAEALLLRFTTTVVALHKYIKFDDDGKIQNDYRQVKTELIEALTGCSEHDRP